jgi:hypothetical protein
MNHYNVGEPFERVGVDIAVPFSENERGKWYLLFAMDYFTKWPKLYAIPNQEASIVADVLVRNFFCCFGAPMEP